MKFPGSECLWKLKAQRLVSGLVEAETALFNSNSSNENMETEEGKARKDSASSIGIESKNHAEENAIGINNNTKILSEEVNHEETDKNEESSDDDEMNVDGVKDEEEENEEEEEVDTEDVDEESDGEDEVEEEEDESSDEMEDDSDVEEGKVKEKSTVIEEEDDGDEKAVKSKGTPEEGETSFTSSKLILPPSSGMLEPKAKVKYTCVSLSMDL